MGEYVSVQLIKAEELSIKVGVLSQKTIVLGSLNQKRDDKAISKRNILVFNSIMYNYSGVQKLLIVA